MSSLNSLGLGAPQVPPHNDRPVAVFSEVQVLGRILRFTGYSIHDVINDPIARNAVIGYYGLYRSIERRCAELDGYSRKNC
jgi:hypothetical protein